VAGRDTPATYFHAGFLLDSFFYLGDGGDIFAETLVHFQQSTQPCIVLQKIELFMKTGVRT
jgi:hypothetical protein